MDVVSVAAASSAYACLAASIVLTRRPRVITRWFGGAEETQRAERWMFLASGASGFVYVVTIWFPIIQTLRRLDPYGPHVPTVPAAIVAAFGLGLLLLIRLDERLHARLEKLVTPLTATVFLTATVQFATAARLLVTPASPHGAYMLAVAAVGLAALMRQAIKRPSHRATGRP